jgi:hypothetical protein
LAIARGALGVGDGDGSSLGELDGVEVAEETSLGGGAQAAATIRTNAVPSAQLRNTFLLAGV